MVLIITRATGLPLFPWLFAPPCLPHTPTGRGPTRKSWHLGVRTEQVRERRQKRRDRLPDTRHLVLHQLRGPHLQCDALVQDITWWMASLLPLDSNLLSHYSLSCPLHSQNSGHLITPRISKSTAGGRSFSYLAPKLWNNLPNIVREAVTLCQFKSRLKTHLFNLAYT